MPSSLHDDTQANSVPSDALRIRRRKRVAKEQAKSMQEQITFFSTSGDQADTEMHHSAHETGPPIRRPGFVSVCGGRVHPI